MVKSKIIYHECEVGVELFPTMSFNIISFWRKASMISMEEFTKMYMLSNGNWSIEEILLYEMCFYIVSLVLSTIFIIIVRA